MNHYTAVTEEEIDRAVEMNRMGYSLSRISRELNRHVRTIQYHLRKRSMSKEGRDRHNAKRAEARRDLEEMRRGRAPFISKDGVGTAGNVGSVKPTPEMIAERDRRFSRPFSIANDILGDPEAGRSALDLRNSGEIRA